LGALSAKCERRWPWVELVVRFLGTATLGSFRYSCLMFQAGAVSSLVYFSGAFSIPGQSGIVEDLDGQAEMNFLLDQRREVDSSIGDGHVVVDGLSAKIC
jgi:hypothetical protein